MKREEEEKNKKEGEIHMGNVCAIVTIDRSEDNFVDYGHSSPCTVFQN